MADVHIASDVVKKLKLEKNRSLKEVSAKVDKLSKFLTDSICLVLSAERKHVKSPKLAQFRDRLIRISEKIYDCIELVTSGRKLKLGFVVIIFWNISIISINIEAELQSFASRIEHYLNQVRDLRGPDGDNEAESQLCLEFHGISSPRSLPSLHQIPHQEYCFLGRDEEEMRKLLLEDGVGPPVIAILGRGGLGKTTLARKLYNRAEVRRRFQGFAWVSVQKDRFDAHSIIKSILKQLLPAGKNTEQFMRMSFLESTELLHLLQQQKKFLIVLRNVWSRDNWRSLRMAFPLDDNTQSQILLTTPAEEVATDCHQHGKSYRMEHPDEMQIGQLFREITGTSLISDIGKIGREMMLSRCRGSPLAITILAGYWNSIKGLVDPQELMCAELQSHPSEDENDVEQNLRSVLSLCYCSLPFNLKACFLYVGQFPSDREIHVDEIFLRWIAEGLIPQDDSEPTAAMEIARSYLAELAQRNLVQVLGDGGERPDVGMVKSCQLHPLVRDYCIDMGEKEKLFEVLPYGTQPKSLASGLTISMSPCKDRDGISSSNAKRRRSLSFVDGCEPPPDFMAWKHGKIFDVQEFKRLNVLEFDGVDFRVLKLPKGMDKLVNLKYLTFKRCCLHELPSSLGNLSNLEALDLRVQAHCVVIIPDILWKLAKLKRLYFPAKVRSAASDGRLKLTGLEELEVLVNVNTKVCHADDLRTMRRLQQLEVIVEEDPEDLERIIDLVSNRATALRAPSLDVRNFNCYSEKRLSVLKRLLACQALGVLRLEGHIEQLPEDVSISPNLAEIVLSGSELRDDPMKWLGRLPKLRSLVICNDAYVGKEMACLPQGFPELRILKLVNFHHVEKWTVEAEAMPKLSTLLIEKCMKLNALPDGLKSMTTLQEVKIVSMPSEFAARVQLGEDVDKISHVPRVILEN